MTLCHPFYTINTFIHIEQCYVQNWIPYSKNSNRDRRSRFIAQLIGLEFYSSAGILVILCVQNTKRKSLQVSLHRF